MIGANFKLQNDTFIVSYKSENGVLEESEGGDRSVPSLDFASCAVSCGHGDWNEQRSSVC